MKWRYEMHFWVSLGELWLARGEPERAESCARRSLAMAGRTTSRKYLVRGWRLEGEIAAARRQWPAAEASLARALAMASSLGNPPQLWQTHLAVGRLRAARGDAEGAGQASLAARRTIETTAAGLSAPELRAGLDRLAAAVPR
jgi:hypothetical protein